MRCHGDDPAAHPISLKVSPQAAALIARSAAANQQSNQQSRGGFLRAAVESVIAGALEEDAQRPPASAASLTLVSHLMPETASQRRSAPAICPPRAPRPWIQSSLFGTNNGLASISSKRIHRRFSRDCSRAAYVAPTFCHVTAR